MPRLACIDIPAFPLQMLLHEHAEWKAHPAAVVAEDRPQAVVLWTNERARRQGVLRGHRYAAALSLAAQLRAGVVAPERIARRVAEVTDRLRPHAPEIEAHRESPGVFWLNVEGLEEVYTSHAAWAAAVCADLATEGFGASVAVGFTRFGTYAVARGKRGVTIFSSEGEEAAAAGRISLARLDVDPALRDALDRLGVRTVEAFLKLPASGLRERFGIEAWRLHQLAAGAAFAPLQPDPPRPPLRQHAILDFPEGSVEGLLFLTKRLLDPSIEMMAARGQALREIILRMLFEDGPEPREERIRPAAPTLDVVQILGLVRLRLEALQMPAPVEELTVTAETAPATREQLLLFASKPRRDLEAASRALARLRAEFGDAAVMRVQLADGHLPAGRFRWEPLERLERTPVPRPPPEMPLVRRFFAPPVQLHSPPPRLHDDGWLLGGLEYGPVTRLHGPYVISGRWWSGAIHRDYYYAEMQRGEVLWVFYDRHRRRCFLEGRVE
ncbi:MAG: DNA polymerase Y family protein [Armatimonadetes bacterium]|nr:DNA polymerase Y family protein [Armatimonadota bacterium]